jgi:hypothetical protein
VVGKEKEVTEKEEQMFAPDVVVNKLREMRVSVTKESYADLAYWKPYPRLSAEEKEDVKQAVSEAKNKLETRQEQARRELELAEKLSPEQKKQIREQMR